MVQVAVHRPLQFQSTRADIEKRLVIDAEGGIGGFYELVDRQRRVVRFYDYIRYL